MPSDMVADTWTKVSLLKGTHDTGYSTGTADYAAITYIDFVMYTDSSGVTFTGTDAWHFDRIRVSTENFIYDLVTQSWVKGDNKFIANEKTNFVTDWNGDLVHTHTAGTVLKWDDTSDTTNSFSFKTKDIDFGQSGQRKKVYKVYISYKGDGGGITVNYGTNGNSTMSGQFYITGSTGASTGANAADLCIYNGSVGTNDWVKAELKPSSSINNIESFRLKFGGDTTNADFEINDISIVYRLKPVK